MKQEPHPNRAAELLRWAADKAATPDLKTECLAASKTVESLAANLAVAVEKLKIYADAFYWSEEELSYGSTTHGKKVFGLGHDDIEHGYDIAASALQEKP
jgi:hypothetical protein